MDLALLPRAAGRRAQALLRQAREARADGALTRTEVELRSTSGHRLAARLTRPAGDDALPAVLVSPPIHAGRADLERFGGPVTAAELARRGFAVLTFDPSGRGDSEGPEDFGGPVHQDDLRVAARWLRERHERMGVLALSLGIAAAAGALARWGDELDVRWLVDWEGPSDREVITAGGTRLEPSGGHALADDAWWTPREATRHVGSMRCGYVRLQADPDHAQPGEVRHATRMMYAAAAGGLPWVQINDHPRGEAPPRPVWHAGGMLEANRVILRKIGALAGG